MCRHKPDKHNLLVTALSERVDDIIREDALVIKLDVEGFEPSALASIHGVFENYRCSPCISLLQKQRRKSKSNYDEPIFCLNCRVGTFFMEYSPGVYEARSKWDEILEMPKMLT